MPYRRVVFTHNNPTPDDELNYEVMFQTGVAKYIVYGREIAPTTGTRHLQGFASLSKGYRWNALRALFPGCHLEVARGKSDCIRDTNSD